MVRGGARELDLDEHVGALVLAGLEGADRTAELEARPRVLGRHLEAALQRSSCRLITDPPVIDHILRHLASGGGCDPFEESRAPPAP